MAGFAAAISDIGDPAVTIGAALCLFAGFGLASPRLAARWLIAVAVCGAGVALAKVALYASGQAVPHTALASPSGHVAGSALIYGSAMLATAGARRRALQCCVWLGIVGAVAASRLLLHMHTGSDILAGLAIGLACLTWFARDWPAAARGRCGRIAAVTCLLLGLGNAVVGLRLPIDRTLQDLADRLANGHALIG